MSTLFNRIINRETPAYIIYEDDKVIAFLDIGQNTKGHTLVVPKVITESVLTADEDTIAYVNIIAQRLALKLSDVLKASGVNILTNANPVSGQTVPHYHVHVIPRYTEDELKFLVSSNSDTIEETFTFLKDHLG
ncbi:HIT family hydrolase [Erysipelothrix larvae]|uniref:HIT family hydrolase n=1 Tax=Erysipelothrix larvae TaxID=1514105 RepID=A0A0X8GZY0_9FIRM|nr:HIT domain-containing protein [Erysipelothrix larvae]AMC93534.1 HIT family hydrolase [Erysipelothrix larvae]